MTMSASVLAEQLKALAETPAATEVEAMQAFADAYAVFAVDAVSNAIPLTAVGVELGKTAMLPALVGLSAPGQGATVLMNGVLAFWAAVAAGLATSFTGATVIIPPPHTGLNSLLQAQGNINVATKASADAATSAIADVFHASAIVGGTVTFGVPVFPIL